MWFKSNRYKKRRKNKKIFGGSFYFTGGYIIAWNKDDNKFLKNAKCENCCSKKQSKTMKNVNV